MNSFTSLVSMLHSDYRQIHMTSSGNHRLEKFIFCLKIGAPILSLSKNHMLRFKPLKVSNMQQTHDTVVKLLVHITIEIVRVCRNLRS